MDERGTEIATTSVFDCLVASWATNGYRKLCTNHFGLRSSIVLTFLIAAYPVWFRCTFHDVTVDISAHKMNKIMLERKVYNNDDITFFSVY